MVFEASGVDVDDMVHDVLIRFCAAFLDQGMAKWQLPRRNEGFYRCFCSLYRHPGWAPADWMRGLANEAGRLLDERIEPFDSIIESLDALGVNDDSGSRFCRRRCWLFVAGAVWCIKLSFKPIASLYRSRGGLWRSFRDSTVTRPICPDTHSPHGSGYRDAST